MKAMTQIILVVMTAALTLLTSVSECGVNGGSCTRRWCKYITGECLDGSLSLGAWNAAASGGGVQGCLLKANGSPLDDLVIQWNRRTGVCSQFRYQKVCRRLTPAVSISSGSVAESATDCAVYRSAALLSCADMATVESEFTGVWLAGGRDRFSNLVCQSEEPANYGLIDANLLWTDEGAKFDGVLSCALLEDSRLVASAASPNFTWLMRLKRQPNFQPLMEAAPCVPDQVNVFGPHVWEGVAANQLYFNKNGWDFSAFNFKVVSNEGVLPSDSNTWINVGVSVGQFWNATSLFYNQGFTYRGQQAPETSPLRSCYNLSIGCRRNVAPSASYYMKGTVRAVAIANYSMPESTIRNLFAAIP